MKNLTVVIPVFNEEIRLPNTFGILKQFRCPKSLRIEKLVFVDDGSKDKTLALLKRFQNENFGKLFNGAEIGIISYPKNKGRGYAVTQGFKEAESDFCLFLDADMSISLDNLKTFSKYMNLGYDILLGSKKLPQTVTLIKRNWFREFIGAVHSEILSFVLGIRLADFTGGFKVFSKRSYLDIFPRLTQNRWGLDPEVIFVANRLGYKMIELPIVWKHISTSSKVSLVRDILRAFKEMAIIKLNGLRGSYCFDEKVTSLSFEEKISSALVE